MEIWVLFPNLFLRVVGLSLCCVYTPSEIVFQEESYSSLHSIVEETLTSGKYILVFLISILNIYIWNLKNYVTTVVFFEEITQKLRSIENYTSEEIKCTIFLLFFNCQRQLS